MGHAETRFGWAASGAALTVLLGCAAPKPAATASPPTTAEPRSAPAAERAPLEPDAGSETPPAPTPTQQPGLGAPAAPPVEQPTAEAGATGLTPQGCAREPATEMPVRRDELGAGDRLIRIKNAAREELQVRLLGATDTPALPGTLRIAPGQSAEFHVAAGRYRLRYRVESTCAVLEGAPIVLTGRRSGVEISLKTEGGAGRAGVKRVDEEL